MVRNSSTYCLGTALCVAMIISGCQSTTKWTAAWQKPKSDFQDVDDKEEVTYWPNKPGKSGSKLANKSGQQKNKASRAAEPNKRETQLAELIREGDQLRKNGQFEDARLIYSKANIISPDNADVHHRLAIVADRQRKYADADEHYQAALRLRPRDPKLLNDIGYSYFLRGNLQLAEVNLREALSIDRTHKLAMANLGTLYAQQGRYDEALEMCRRGTTSEAEAQQYVAQLAAQTQALAQAGSSPGMGHAATDPIVTAKPDGGRDLSKMTQDQIQQEMAQLKQEGQRRRLLEDQKFLDQSRNMIAEDERYQQQQLADAMQNSQRTNGAGSPLVMGARNPNSVKNTYNGQGSAPAQGQQNFMQGSAPGGAGPADQGNPPFANQQQTSQGYPAGQQNNAQNAVSDDRWMNPPTQNQTQAGGSGDAPLAKIYRGSPSSTQQGRPNDPQYQQGWDQRAINGSPNNGPGPNVYASASQMALQLGMSAGPGGMFPMMPVNEPGNPSIGNSNVARDSRFGGDMQRSFDQQNPQNWGGNQIEQTSKTDHGASANEMPTQQMTVPMSPANNWPGGSPATNWSSPSMNQFNWQNDTKNLSDWSTETTAPNGQAAGTANQNLFRRGNGVDLQPGLPTNPSRPENEMSRPYNGAWPNPQNANSLPQRQNANIQINSRSPETREILGMDAAGADSMNDAPSQSYSRQNSAPKNTSNDIQMYPYAPNR